MEVQIGFLALSAIAVFARLQVAQLLLLAAEFFYRRKQVFKV
jgi:hypothetical protein